MFLESFTSIPVIDHFDSLFGIKKEASLGDLS